MKKSFTIATIGSHTALPILWGAKKEGFNTLVITTPKRKRVYAQAKFIDQIIEVTSFSELFQESLTRMIQDMNPVFIPHGSYFSYFSLDEILSFPYPLFGNKRVLSLEANVNKHQQWLEKSKVRIPMRFKNPDDVDRLVIVKFTGAKGGKGYFVTESSSEIWKRLQEKNMTNPLSNTWIQEYVRGVPMYFHFFKRGNGENILTGLDVRYESDASAFGRIPAEFQIQHNLQPMFTVTGNIPIVIRESLLEIAYDMADNVVRASNALAPPGLVGPYCIETIITPDLEPVVIEISARIVAGTTAVHTTSPYMEYFYGEPISVGQLIARELRDHGLSLTS